MSAIDKPERETQERVIGLFHDELSASVEPLASAAGEPELLKQNHRHARGWLSRRFTTSKGGQELDCHAGG